jgi:hypothetical protein
VTLKVIGVLRVSATEIVSPRRLLALILTAKPALVSTTASALV